MDFSYESHDDGVFLVMELVRGQTLRSAATGQTPAQVVRAYRRAGCIVREEWSGSGAGVTRMGASAGGAGRERL